MSDQSCVSSSAASEPSRGTSDSGPLEGGAEGTENRNISTSSALSTSSVFSDFDDFLFEVSNPAVGALDTQRRSVAPLALPPPPPPRNLSVEGTDGQPGMELMELRPLGRVGGAIRDIVWNPMAGRSKKKPPNAAATTNDFGISSETGDI